MKTKTEKTRAQRETELQAKMRNREGVLQIVKLYTETVLLPGESIQMGMLVSRMIPEILEAEFPNERVPSDTETLSD
ncbi:MAG TPA: hypothetical protein VKU82_08995 [Planctomycetaceae bacterium]|nr:hypothetical protein [Planctomycetaceae bacterium]